MVESHPRMADERLYEAASYFFNEPYQISSIGRSSGYSDSHLARVTDQRGQLWCLRQWADPTADLMRFIHQVLTHSRAQGFTGVPQLAHTRSGETLLLLDNAWFEAQEWIAGGPAYRLAGHEASHRTPNTAWHFTVEERRAVTSALADFHSSTETLQPLFRKHSCLAQVSSVLQQAQIQQQVASELLPASRSPEDMAVMILWLDLLPVLTAHLQQRATDRTFILEHDGTICHNDLWPDHVYFADGSFRGFVDFGALTRTSPAIDLAQLILHFGGWQTCEEVLTVYTSYRPLSTQDTGMLPIAAASDLVSEGYWSLSQLRDDKLPEREVTAHWHNLYMLLPSLKALAAALT